MVIQFDLSSIPADKFQELILHIAEQSENDRNFGATKLNKLLFYADFLFYLRNRRSITGQNYQKLNHGPAPRGLKPAVDNLELMQSAKIVERTHFGRTQKRLVALRSADLSVFTAEEISFVDSLIKDFWDKNATDVSDMSHRFHGWQLAKIGEEIPYSSVFVNARHTCESDYANGQCYEERARELTAGN